MLGFDWKSASLAVVLALASVGCGGKTVKVEGTVTLDGTPVEGASVVCTPVDGGESGRTAQGLTGPGGVFHLTTTKPDDGALPGEYKVAISYKEPVELDQPAKNMAEAMAGAGMTKGKKPPPKAPRYVIPPVYSNSSTTTLRLKVPPDGPVAFPLTKSGK